MAYMREALKDVLETPLEMPEGITTVRIDPKTGKRARAGQKDAIFEVFRVENAPQEQAPSVATATDLEADQTGDTPAAGSSAPEEDPF